MADDSCSSIVALFRDLSCTDTEVEYGTRRKETFIRFYTQLINQDIDWEPLISVLSTKDVSSIGKLYDTKILDNMYNINKSITQSLRCTTGRVHEKLIEDYLKKNDIPYCKQVFVKDNVVMKKTRKVSGGHILDFVIPSVAEGDNMENYVHISAKSTLRERVHQDQHIQCKRNIVVTYDKQTEQAHGNGFTCITLDRHNVSTGMRQLISLLRQEIA